jgi:carbamoyl-phosphate synthase large subunit
MPKRTDIKTILILGSGPIVIGQAAEFDYSGHPGLQGAARERLRGRADQRQPGDDHDRPRGGRPHLRRAADAGVRGEGHRGRAPDALLPTLGGQTGLNLRQDLHEAGWSVTACA